jgi:hypothetical protein
VCQRLVLAGLIEEIVKKKLRQFSSFLRYLSVG